MSAHESPKKVQVSYFDTDDVGHLCVSAARPLPVTDAAAIAVLNPSPAGAAETKVDVALVSIALIAANSSRQSLTFYNSSANTVYLSNVTPAVATAAMPLVAGAYMTRDPASGSKLGWWAIALVAGPSTVYIESVI